MFAVRALSDGPGSDVPRSDVPRSDVPRSDVPGSDVPGSGAAAGREGEAARYTAAVYGADHPGIVHGVAELLASLSVNIVDLSTRVSGGADDPVYAMVLEVTLPADVDPGELQRQLQARAAELGVTCRLHPSEADIL